MALYTHHPVEKDGKVYDKLAVNLAMSPMQQENGFGVSIAVRLTPYRVGEDGPEKLEEDARAVVYGDATVDAANDPVLAKFLMDLEAAGQSFINGKGL